MRLGLNRDDRRVGRNLVIDDGVIERLVTLFIVIIDQSLQFIFVGKHQDALNILWILKRNRQRLVPDNSLIAGHPTRGITKTVITHF